MNVEKLVEREESRETEILFEKPPHYHFVYDIHYVI
jgi:hypothetical protein